jgi:hypothetical protein
MRLHRTYPIWLHLLHVIYHGGMLSSQLAGFGSTFHSPNNNVYVSEIAGPGWRFRYVTTWILSLLVVYMLAAFLFDVLLLLRGVNDIIVKQLKIYFDRFFCLFFSTNVGLGFFFHLLFFINCKNNNHCPKYTDSLWFIHLMPFWYAFAEYLFVPHNTRRDIKTTPIFVFIFCLMYCINYWLFVAQTHGHHPYGDPWPVWQWLIYFCFPLAMLVLRLLGFVRDRLFYKRRLRSPCIHPPLEFYANPWIGWHANYTLMNECEMQPIDLKAIGVMIGILSSVVAIWNISYLATSR